ncbi:protein RIC-3b [Diretmus argenteus]
MSMSTFQKVTLATCLVLCVALLLPRMLLSRGKKDAERPDGLGRFPPMIHRQAAPEGQRAAGSQFSRAHNTEAIARAKGANTGGGTGAGMGGKSNLAGQIIPIYGFAILLYILYILFKITSKGNSKPPESRFPPVRSENMKRKITDFELTQLQEKLRETELVMENIVSNANHSPDWGKGVSSHQEQSLLLQLREITRVMQEGRLVEGVAPESKQQDDWEGYPEEPPQYWEHPCCPHHHGDPQTEAERTEADGADGADAAEAESEDSKRDVAREAAESDAGANGEEDAAAHEPKEGVEEIDLGVPEEDLAGVLEELELTLKMTSVMEREKMEDLTWPTEEADAGCSQVRRRNKRRRAKRD